MKFTAFFRQSFWSMATAPAEAIISPMLWPVDATVSKQIQNQIPIQVQNVPLGTPLPNVHAYVFHTHGASVPPGAVGDLYLGGGPDAVLSGAG